MYSWHPWLTWKIRRLLLAAGLTLCAIAAFPQSPGTREEALAALGSPDAAARAGAIVWIARHGAEGDAAPLYERLGDADPTVRGYAEQALWLLWSRSGDPELDRLMERGSAEMSAGRHREAIATFSQVISRNPGFAEGWNKRATALFLAGEFRRSLADCDEVLKRNPRHFGALSGAGLNHLQLEQPREALEWFKRALEVNPNMGAIEEQRRRLEELLRDRSARYSVPPRRARTLKSSA
jgi:tetratricopeptide (TPR) repeat protein